MTTARKFQGEVKDGQFAAYNPDAMAQCIRDLEGKRIVISIDKWRQQRSLSQNKYYWGVVVQMIAEASGYTKDEAHEALALKFLRKNWESSMPTVRSTTELTTQEFGEYLDSCIILAAEMFGLSIPAPTGVAA